MNRGDLNKMGKDSAKEMAKEMEGLSVSEQAAHWWVVLHGETVSPVDHREFGEWVARSPERVEAFLRTELLMRTVKSSDVSWPDTSAEELIREAKAAPADVVPLQVRMSQENGGAKSEWRRARSFMPYLAGIAATLLIAVALFYFTGPQSYGTDIGEQRSVVLADGSVVTLNTASRIDVVMDEHRRAVHLQSGEALFQVAHETRRPFDVVTGDTTVRAVGTRFNVDRRATNTTVTVVEGKVALLRADASGSSPKEAPVYLVAAERAVITASEVSPPQHVANVAAATAWTQRRLVFDRRPLGEVAEEFNRYNRRRIRIADPQLRTQEVTGVFQANDPESFVVFLSELPGVNVRRSEEEISVVADH